MNIQPNQCRKISLYSLIKQQDQERGIQPLALEPELLLKRVTQGGHSGQYLADAFISTYRNQPFAHSLYELIKLDAEGFRLFHQILHCRHVPGWNDEALFQIEKQIKAIIQEASNNSLKKSRAKSQTIRRNINK